MPPRPRPECITWTGSVFRATTYDVPLWVNPNRRNGRWNIAGHDPTQYMCLDAEAPFAEMLRGEDLKTEAEARMFRTILWQLRIDDGAIVDYSTFEKADAQGFSPQALVEDDHERCQAEAEWLKSHGVRGLLTPSAALPRSINLTLFGERVPVDWNTTVKLASMIPVQKLAEGNAPPGLVERTRHYGTEHAGLREYRETQKRLF